MTATIKELMDAGAHFGHQTHKWNPKMREYIFDKRNGIHIINLDLTIDLLAQCCALVSDLAARGKKILFVGTKQQAKHFIQETAKELKMPYVSERWLGGMLTNLKTIKQSVSKLDKYIEMEETGALQEFSKKEQAGYIKEKAKLEKYLSGVKDMTNELPDMLFVIDPKKEHLAVKEAKKLNIPVIGLLDTNCDPEAVDYCIPANDDSIRTIQYVLGKIKEAIIKGNDVWRKSEEIRKAKELELKAKEEAKKEEVRKKAEEIKKAKEEAEAKQKEKTDAIIADLTKSEKHK